MSILKSLAMPFIWCGKVVTAMDSWLFTDKERAPMGFIYLFFLMIIVSTAVCLFIISVGRAMMWI